MKTLKTLTALTLTIPILASPVAVRAADAKTDVKVKPYTLNFCVVSGDKLGEMGKPFVITNDNREIKFCCKNCVKDFKKEPEKFLKKIDEAEAKAKVAEKK